jgi:hypothetical protein
MNLRSLLCAALLLVTPALARQSAAPVAPAQSTSEGAQQASSGLTNLQVECTPASGATQLIGKHACIAGKVYRITVRKSGNTHLWLCPSGKCSFQAVVYGRSRASVGDLSYLRGKFVAVLGDVSQSRGGRPIIAVNDREQIRVAAGEPPPEFDTAQARPTIHGKAIQPFAKYDHSWK